MTNVGKWTSWYQGTQEPWPYGDTRSYEIGAAWLANCSLTEDWGCGTGWLSTLIPPERYRGIDGTPSPCCAQVVDLAAYRSSVPRLFMRHILEHNYEWLGSSTTRLRHSLSGCPSFCSPQSRRRPKKSPSIPALVFLTSPFDWPTSQTASRQTWHTQ
jgi:hypothetical protein